MTPGAATPVGHKAMAMATPTPGHLVTMTPEQLQASIITIDSVVSFFTDILSIEQFKQILL